MKNIILTMIGLFFLTGCSVEGPTPLPIAVSTNKPAVTSPPLNTSTPSPVPTFTLTPDLKLVESCLTIRDQGIDLPDVAKNGTVLLSSGLDDPLILFDLQTGIQYKLPLTRENDRLIPLVGTNVSPNGSNLAYIELIGGQSGGINEEILRVVDPRGSVLASQSFGPNSPVSEWHWLDTERLEMFFPKDQKDGKVSVFNPFTKEWKYLTNKFPNFYQDFDLRPPGWAIDYSPDLEWVIYFGDIGQNTKGPIVWDVTAEKPIWQAENSLVRINRPQWSPSGREVAVVAKGKLYRINRNGDAISPPLSDENEVAAFSWSPNEQYIALLVSYKQHSDDGRIMLYDIEANQVIDYCIQDDSIREDNQPLWSIDSQMFVYRLSRSDTEILVDVQGKSAYKLQDISILAWMNSLP